MNVLDRTLPWLPRIDLSREPEFSLGELRVRPSRREVEAGELRLALQPRVMQVLVALAHPSSDVVSQDELISRCWGGLTVGEDAVARCISQLRRAAASWPEPPFQIETIPGVGYRMTPTAVISSEVVEPLPVPRPFWRGRGAWIGAAAVAAVGAISAGVLALHPWRAGQAAASAPNPTIAVLGFQPVGSSAGEKALAAALPTRVADALSGYNVTVISGTGAGADFTVNGRVADKDGRLHVTADLTDPHSHVLVYSFDTAVPDDPKGDVASEVASHVALSLDPFQISSTLGKLTPADYVLVARANDAVDSVGWLADLDQLRKLADRHPEDGDVQASVAVPAIKAAEGAPPDQRPQLVQLARESMARAERLNPNSAGLYMARALLQNGPLGYPERERLVRKSVSLNPNISISNIELGATMLALGRTEEGASLVKRAVQLDPTSYSLVSSAVAELFWAGRLEDSAQVLEHLRQTWPDSERVAFSRYSIAFLSGDMQQVLAVDQRYHLSVQPGTQQALTHQSVQLGGQRALTVEAARARDPASISQLADECTVVFNKKVGKTDDWVCLVALTRFGRLDDAFRLAAIRYPDHRGFAPASAEAWNLYGNPFVNTSLLLSPAMKPFRDDPRFWDVAVRTGLVNYWQTTGYWPDFCQSQLDSCKRLAAAAALADPPPPLRRQGPAVAGG
jgi:DNA-binding winged helix-turn-helix (wHTH) protein